MAQVSGLVARVQVWLIVRSWGHHVVTQMCRETKKKRFEKAVKYMPTYIFMEVTDDHRSEYPISAIGIKKPEKKKKKNQGFNGFQTRDLRDTGFTGSNPVALILFSGFFR